MNTTQSPKDNYCTAMPIVHCNLNIMAYYQRRHLGGGGGAGGAVGPQGKRKKEKKKEKKKKEKKREKKRKRKKGTMNDVKLIYTYKVLFFSNFSIVRWH